MLVEDPVPVEAEAVMASVGRFGKGLVASVQMVEESVAVVLAGTVLEGKELLLVVQHKWEHDRHLQKEAWSEDWQPLLGAQQEASVRQGTP